MKKPLLLLPFIALAAGVSQAQQLPSVTPTLTAAQRQEANEKARKLIQENIQLSNQTGLTALVLDPTHHTWQDLDAYYHNLDTLACDVRTKAMLKQKAIFGLVRMHDFLNKAPLTTREYYAAELLAQQHPQPDLLVAFLENLKSGWSPEKVAQVKTQTMEQIGIALKRNEAMGAQIGAALQVPTTTENQRRMLQTQADNEKARAKLLELQQQVAQ